MLVLDKTAFITRYKDLPSYIAKYRSMSKMYDIYDNGVFVGEFMTRDNKTNFFKETITGYRKLTATTYNYKNLHQAMQWIYLKSLTPKDKVKSSRPISKPEH